MIKDCKSIIKIADKFLIFNRVFNFFFSILKLKNTAIKITAFILSKVELVVFPLIQL